MSVAATLDFLWRTARITTVIKLSRSLSHIIHTHLLDAGWRQMEVLGVRDRKK